jgi:hypothetical protein
MRACQAWEKQDDECADEAYEGIKAEVCVCFTDKCNGASAMSATLIIPLLGAVSAIFS